MVKVITYGTFDLFHEGHYRLLERAKALGDYLIVGVTTENYDKTRGKLNVVDSLMTRIENVKKSGFADEVIIEESVGQKVSDVKRYKVDIFAIGSDWVGSFDYMSEYCKVVYLERTKDVSSTVLRNRNFRIQRIGIIGSGRIAGRFLAEARAVSGVNVQGVFNPHLESGEQFAKKYEVDCFCSPEEMYEKTEVIYVASPHETHYQYTKDALEHGKHVICEKPLAMEKKQAEELFALAKEKNLVLYEGIKAAHCPGFTKLMDMAGSGVIGNIRYVDACFTKLEGKKTRELTDPVYGGSFLELGSYCMLPVMKLFGTDYQSVHLESIYGENDLDLFTKASFQFQKGLATVTCGLGVKSEGRLLIGGTKGYIIAEAPWWKTQYFEVHYEDPTKVEKYTERFLGDGLRYEIGDFLTQINGNANSEFKLLPEESIAMAEVMELFMKKERRKR